MAAGARTLYVETTGAETFSSTTPAAWSFDTRLAEDSAVTLDSGATSSIFTVNETGRYLMGFNTVWRTTSGISRLAMAVKHRVTVNGTDLVDMRSVSFVYSQGGTLRAYPAVSGILELEQGDEVQVEYNRQDSNTAVNAARVASSSGVWFLRLKDDWPIIRLHRANNTGEITTTAAGTPLEWDTQDIVESPFQHSTSVTPETITLGRAGYYLICVNVVCARSRANTTHVAPTLNFAGNALPVLASYMHNGSNCNETSLNFMAVHAATIDNQTIDFSLNNESDGTGTNDFVVLGGQCAISIVQLPYEGTAFVYAHEDAGGQAADVDAYLEWDTTDYDNSFMDHNPGGSAPTEILLTDPGWYLFFGQAYSDRDGGSATPLAHRFVWHASGTAIGFGQFGRQDLGDGLTGGNQPVSGSHGSLFAATTVTNTTLQLRHFEDSTGSDTACDFYLGTYGLAVQGVRLDALFPAGPCD